MDTYAIAVVGRDRPGIIADVTGALASHRGNVEDSSMSLLRGTFAWTLIVSFEDVDQGELESTLEPLRRPDLALTVHPLAGLDDQSTRPMTSLQLTVHGSDHPGIVSAVTRVIADHQGNVTDLSTKLVGGLFVVVAEFDLPAEVELEAFGDRLHAVAQEVGVVAHVSPADSDLL